MAIRAPDGANNEEGLSQELEQACTDYDDDDNDEEGQSQELEQALGLSALREQLNSMQI